MLYSHCGATLNTLCVGLPGLRKKNQQSSKFAEQSDKEAAERL